jgi:hypothetical protein
MQQALDENRGQMNSNKGQLNEFRRTNEGMIGETEGMRRAIEWM